MRVWLEAEVEPQATGAGMPTGTVTFEQMKKTKVKVLGTETLSGGEATLRLTARRMLRKAITIVYDGDTDYLSTQLASPKLTRKSLKSLARPMSVFFPGNSERP